MGLDLNETRFLLAAKASGVCFTKTATLGRQEFRLGFHGLKKELSAFGITQPDAAIERLVTEGNGYAEPFLRMLGAQQICSIDSSAYENASLVHDMNLPVPSEVLNAFTVVIDGGSLEHIFDFPRAIRSCMEMVQVGGHFLGITPVNNYMGHGFYQFSPELYCRVFSPDNGFRIEKLMLLETTAGGRWYHVEDPAKVGKRVMLVNFQPTQLLIQARKIGSTRIFASIPQQSDYVAAWNKPRSSTRRSALRRSRAVERVLRERTPEVVKKVYRLFRAARGSRFNRQFFRTVTWDELHAGQRIR